MLSKSDIEVLSTVFGKTSDEISGAISGEEEVSLGLALQGKIYKPDEIESLKKTQTDAGVEIGMKKVAKAMNIELDAGEKKPEVIAQKYRSSIIGELEEKYKNPEPGEELKSALEKVVELENKYKTLYDTHSETEKKVGEWESKYNEKINEIEQGKLDRKILNAFPEKLLIDRADALLLAKNVLEFRKNEDGGTVILKGGKEQLNPVGEAESLENVIKSLVEEKKWIKTKAGMNGGDRGSTGGTGGPKGLTHDQAFKYLKDKDIDPMSDKGLKLFAEMTKPA